MDPGRWRNKEKSACYRVYHRRGKKRKEKKKQDELLADSANHAMKCQQLYTLQTAVHVSTNPTTGDERLNKFQPNELRPIFFHNFRALNIAP